MTAATAALAPAASLSKWPADGFAANRALQRGVNWGDFLEGHWQGRASAEQVGPNLDRIQKAGFTFIRLPVRWSVHAAEEAPYTIDPKFFDVVDGVVHQAMIRQIPVILNIHHFNALTSNPAAQHQRFLALWKQIAAHYQHYPPRLLFEILNEPHGALTAPLWNQYLQQALDILRRTNPKRIVVVGPVQWNSLRALSTLKLPADDHRLIVTFHFYEPFHFTHQGAGWVKGSSRWLGTTWKGTPEEHQFIDKLFDQAAAWGKKHHRPLFLGEFGAFSKGTMADRARWTAYVRSAAEQRGFSWAYWEFNSGFGVYNPRTGQWRKPLLDALISN